jgi:hypothetical protein
MQSNFDAAWQDVDAGLRLAHRFNKRFKLKLYFDHDQVDKSLVDEFTTGVDVVLEYDRNYFNP